jgi:hypothetical protein
MASKKTPAAKQKKPVVAKPAAVKHPMPSPTSPATKSAAKAVTAAPARKAAPLNVNVAELIGSPDAMCANLAALRAALVSEKSKEGSAERKKITEDLEVLAAGYRELHK